jgi:CheY-like chemotaxis protein
MLMKNPDYVILTSSNGKSACEIASEELPDLIIMDWQMPVMTGIEATMQMKQNELTKSIPILITTGVMINSTNLNTALMAGAFDFLRKPFDEMELTARVTNMLKLTDAYLKIKQQNIELQGNLTSKLINLQQLNELKAATIKHLASIKEQASIFENKQIKEAVLNTERLLYSKAYQINWEDFESHFEFIHQGFFNKLRAKYGDFTQNELRLCAFIKLNMSNKDIALIIYTSPDSVNTARKRLKKKLGLLPNESLQSLIRNL